MGSSSDSHAIPPMAIESSPDLYHSPVSRHFVLPHPSYKLTQIPEYRLCQYLGDLSLSLSVPTPRPPRILTSVPPSTFSEMPSVAEPRKSYHNRVCMNQVTHHNIASWIPDGLTNPVVITQPQIRRVNQEHLLFPLHLPK